MTLAEIQKTDEYATEYQKLLPMSKAQLIAYYNSESKRRSASKVRYPQANAMADKSSLRVQIMTQWAWAQQERG